jgi:hypothetical protein
VFDRESICEKRDKKRKMKNKKKKMLKDKKAE